MIHDAHSVQRSKYNDLGEKKKTAIRKEFMRLFGVSEPSFYKALNKKKLKDDEYAVFFSMSLNIPIEELLPALRMLGKPKPKPNLDKVNLVRS